MGHPPVFISYARSVRAEQATALRDALGELAFLDTTELEHGDRFPRSLFEAVSNARVVVVFADPEYFERWYCLRELRCARADYDRESARADPDEGTPERATRKIVVALPPEGAAPAIYDALPAPLRTILWPNATQTDELRELILGRLADEELATPPAAALDPAVESLVDELALPAPGDLGRVPFFSASPFPPSLGSAFVGRSSLLERLFFELFVMRGGAGAAALSAALGGAGGVGKTRAAIEFVWRYGPTHFPGGVVWIDANEERRELQLHGALATLEPGTPSLADLRAHNVDVSRRLAQALGGASARGPILWVIDNYPEPAAGQSPRALYHWCPGGSGHVALLVTSRMRVEAPGLRNLDVGPLARAAATRLLCAELEPDLLSEPAAESIASWVGDLPLALELLNRVLFYRAVSPAGLLALTTQTEAAASLDTYADALADQVPAGSLRGVTQTLLVSFEQLSLTARRLAIALAHCAPEAIPLALVDELGALADAGARVSLIRRHLVTRAVGDSYGTMHRLVAQFLRARWQQAPRRPLRGLVRRLLGKPDEFSPRSVARSALQSLVAAQRQSAARDRPLIDALVVHGVFVLELGLEDASEDDLELAKSLAAITMSEDRFEDCERLSEHAAVLARKLVGPTSEVTLGIQRVRLGAHWRGTRHPDSQPALEQLLAKQERFLGPDAPETLETKEWLAAVMHTRGQFRAAADLRHALCKTHERLHGAHDRRTARANLELTATLAELGAAEQAQRHQERLLEAFEASLGRLDSLTLRAMVLLGVTLDRRGRHRRTCQVRAEIVERMRELDRPEREVLGHVLDHAASLYAMGEVGRARALEAEVLSKREEILGHDHPETLIAANNLGVTLLQMAEYDDARALLERALAGQRRVLGDDDPETLKTLNNLSGLCNEVGDYAAARAFMAEVLERRRRMFGPDHPETLQSLSQLALMDSRVETEGATLHELEAALESGRSRIGFDEPATRHLARVLSRRYVDLGRAAEARALLEPVLERARTLLGDDHDETLHTTHRLALALAELDEEERACELLARVVACFEVQLGLDHPRTLDVSNSLALLLGRCGEKVEATRRLAIVLERRRARSPGFDDTQVVAWNLLSMSQGSAAAVAATWPEMVRLLDAEPSELSVDLRAIRAQLEAVEGLPSRLREQAACGEVAEFILPSKASDADEGWGAAFFASLPPRIRAPMSALIHWSDHNVLYLGDEGTVEDLDRCSFDHWDEPTKDGHALTIVTLVPSEADFAAALGDVEIFEFPASGRTPALSPVVAGWRGALEQAFDAAFSSEVGLFGAEPVHYEVVADWRKHRDELVSSMLVTADEGGALVLGPRDVVWLRLSTTGDSVQPNLRTHRKWARMLTSHNPHVCAAKSRGIQGRSAISVHIDLDDDLTVVGGYLAIDAMRQCGRKFATFFAPLAPLYLHVQPGSPDR